MGRKSIWNPLGDYISKAEHTFVCRIDPNNWYTLRADGKGFSKMVKELKRNGILEEGYSKIFEKCMIRATEDVFGGHFYSFCAFTQSDEISIVFRKADICSDGQISNYESGGSTIKYLTHESSSISSRFTYYLIQESIEKYQTDIRIKFDTIKEEIVGKDNFNGIFDDIRKSMSILDIIKNIPVITFDCRFAQWNSFEAAFQLILWRSWDCSSNGVSNGIHIEKGLKNKRSKALQNTHEKLKTMKEDGILFKLNDHQMYGTFLYKAVEEKEKYVEYTKKTITVKINKIKKISFPILKLFKEGCIKYNEATKLIEISSFDHLKGNNKLLKCNSIQEILNSFLEMQIAKDLKQPCFEDDILEDDVYVDWNSIIKYKKGNIIMIAGLKYKSLVDNNNAIPIEGKFWKELK